MFCGKLCPSHCSEESKVAPSFHEAKRPKKPSDRAVKIQRKRAIEKEISQDQQAAQKTKN